MASVIKKIGFIIDSLTVDQFQNSIITWACSNKNFEVFLILYKKNSLTKFYKLSDKSIWELISVVLTKLLRKYEFFFLGKEKLIFSQSFKINKLETKKIIINPLFKTNKFSFFFSNRDVNKIKNKKIDILVRLGSGILRGSILNASKNGIISVHCGDEQNYRGGPPGFWEVLNKEPNSYFIIQRLNHSLDNGFVYLKGSIQTQNIWLRNQLNLYKKSNFFLKKVINDIASKNNSFNEYSQKPYLKKIFKFPGVISILKYFFLIHLRFIKNKFFKKKALYKTFYQEINWKKVTLNNSKFLTPRKKNVWRTLFVLEIIRRVIFFAKK